MPLIIDEKINDIIVYSNNPLYENWNLNEDSNKLIKYILPTEDLEDLNYIKNQIDNIENYNFKEIITKYNLNNFIISLIFKNNFDIKILSKIYIKDQEIIINNSFQNYNFNDQENLINFMNELKTIYEDLWKQQNQINTSIKLPLMIRVNNKNLTDSLIFENILNEIDLISYYTIKNFDKDHIFYEVIFNGTPNFFINFISEKNYIFDTQNKIWILK